MARIKRHVAKLVLATMVLATVGAGAMYVAVDRDWISWPSSNRPTAQLVVDETASPRDAFGSSSELDAVARAWTDTAASGPEKPRATTLPAVPAAQVALAEYPSKPTPASAAAPKLDEEDRYAVPTVAAPSPVEVEEPIARGQNDTDDAADTHSESSASSRSSKASEPTASARRAREAFRDEQPTSSQDRYGNASHVSPLGASDRSEHTQVNPFASQPAPISSATQSARSIEPIQPLESRLPEDDGGLDRRSSSEPGYRPMESSSSARISSSGTAGGYGSQRRSTSLGSLSEATGGHSPSFDDRPYDASTKGTGRPGERALEGPQNGSLMIQKFAPAEIQVGKPAKFIVKVRNAGNRPADNVVIHDEVPEGTRLVSTSPRADVDGSHLSWQLSTLSAGEERAVEVQLIPTEEGELGSVATVSFETPASVKARCTMPQLAIRMTAPNEVMIGDEQRVRIEIRNPGSGDATGVMLFENVPQEVRHAAGPTLEFEIGTLRAGETRELELVLTAERAGHVTNVLTARADGNLQVQQQVEFDVIAPALEVAVDGPSRRYLERPAKYEVTVGNPGTAAAKDVEIVTKLPRGMRFVRANNMGEYDAATHAVYWSLAELPEGERGTVELVAMPIEAGQQTLEVEGRAQQGLSDQTSQHVLVEGLAAIMFTVTDLEDPIEVGGETEYEIRVVNQGSKAATNVQVRVLVPPELQVVSANGETRHEITSSGIMFEPLGQLPPKAESVFRVHVQGLRPGDQRVTVEVDTDDISQPIRKEESTRVFGDE